MKNVKYLGFIGLGCALLLLTGCGVADNYRIYKEEYVPLINRLTCTKIGEDPGESQILKYEIEFNDKSNEITGLKYYYIVEVTEDISDDEVE